MTVVRLLPRARPDRARIRWVLPVLACLLAGSLLSPPGSNAADGDDRTDRLRERRESLGDRITDKRSDLHEVSRQLVQAQARFETAVEDLALARQQLTEANTALAAAVSRDEQLESRLADAVARLKNATQDLRVGAQAVVDKRAELAGYAVSSYSSSDTQLLDLGLSLAADTTGEALDEVQLSTSLLDKQSVVLQELQANEVLLSLTEERVEAARDQVAIQREDAADQLAATQTLREQAALAQDTVIARVADLRNERTAISALKKSEIERLDTLQADREEIQDTLVEIAQRRARQNDATVTRTTPADAGGVLGWPIGGDTYVTSPYGMRLHPILRIWKLHDGLDFSAACGTPLYAPEDGVVQSAYYNAGYGNRIVVDHGFVNGVSLWTSVNHLSSFAVSPGERVQRGQLLGFSGTTGYSTGCHLHFMVYVNGYTVDPVEWL